MTNILLVDDDVSVLNSLKRALRGFNVFTALNGWEALGLLAHTPFALVICDLAMPHMSGLQLLTKLKERYPEVVRVALTGQSDINWAVGAVNEGNVYRFFTKPWDDDELKDAIRDALEHFEARQTGDSLPRREVSGCPGAQRGEGT